MILTISVLVIIVFIVGLLVFLEFAPQLGGKQTGERKQRIQRSANFRDGKFRNLIETPMSNPEGSQAKSVKEFVSGGQDRVPETPLPSTKVDPNRFQRTSNEGLKVTWLGHSMVLLEMNGQLLLTDPVFNKRPSPIPFVGPKAFPGTTVLTVGELPELDAVIISHDHYDHLDHRTILQLQEKTKKFFVPLGVGAHLERWGVPAEKIVELDWWEEAPLYTDLELTATPARHFSGRKISWMFTTLWCSWVIQGPDHSVFFGGDSGYFPGFAEIGEKFGPFHVTMLDSGQYSVYWPNVHMLPEQTVQAHQDLGGDVLLPIHWGKYKLSIHPWNEPPKRALEAARENGVNVVIPKIGESFFHGEEFAQTEWWES